MIYTAHPWQDDITGHQLDVDRGATWAGVGTGKSVATLTTLQMIHDLLDPRPHLIIGTKRVASRTWPREVPKWDHISGDTAVCAGTAADRMAALRGGLRSGNAARFTVSYDNLPWLIQTLADLKIPWPFSAIVADENTKLRGFRTRQGTVRSRILSTVAFESRWFFGLTGTPAPNGLKNLWGPTWFMDRGHRLGKSYTAYMERWFRKGYDGFSWEPMDHAYDEVHGKLRDICLSVDVPVEDFVDNKVMVDLPPKARDLYRKMEREAFAEIGAHGIEAVHAAAKMNKLLQIASGAIYDEDHVAHFLHDAKIEALQEIIDECNGMPVLVAINFQFEAPFIVERIKGARFLTTDQDIDDFAAGKIGCGVAHPASLGHGINDMEKATNVIVFYSGDFNRETYDQISGRIGPMRQKQSGFERKVYRHHILVEDSMDEVVYESRVGKGSIQDLIFEAMKRRGL